MRTTVVVTALFATIVACGSSEEEKVTIYVPAWAEAALQMAGDDVARDLERITNSEVKKIDVLPTKCDSSGLQIVVEGVTSRLENQEIEIVVQDCDGGTRITTAGGSLMSAQWALYTLMEQLGVRYLHPEQTYYPALLSIPPIGVFKQSPKFQRRSFHAHTTHPIELSPPRNTAGVDMGAFQKRWVDWNVKIRSTQIDGVDNAFVGDYPYVRGFPRRSGMNLLNSQQGGRPIIDTDDPRPESDQLAEAITHLLEPQAGLPEVTKFGFSFNPSEFTEADHTQTVGRLEFVTNYIASNYPDVDLTTTNHGTYLEPGPLGVSFFDLPQFAPKELGVQVHTLMFYDLERPAAGVYGNVDFSHKLDWIIQEQSERRIIHYPESSWWLTFDLPVPLYLAPVTLEARNYDIQLLADMLSESDESSTGVYGHHLFTSGQEWGYWMIDYCVARMTWDLSSHTDCYEHVTSGFARSTELVQILTEMEASQVADLRDPELLRFLVGSDDETETAEQAGIFFHPLPPRPAEILGLSDNDILALENNSMMPLALMAQKYHAWANRLEAIAEEQEEEAKSWVQEMAVGTRVFALRAEHAVAVYDTAISLRLAILDGDWPRVTELEQGLQEAREITQAATALVRDQEARYRYPEELTIVGDEPGTSGAVANNTIYPYRYLSRTHRMFYWHRSDEQLASLFDGGVDPLSVNERILVAGTPFVVNALVGIIGGLVVDWGDGQQGVDLNPHVYPAEGLYDWEVDAATESGALQYRDTVAVVESKMIFPKGALEISEPAMVSVIEGLIPGLVIGLGDDGAPFLAVGQIYDQGLVAAKSTVVRRGRNGATSGPEDLVFQIPDVGTITVFQAIIEVDETANTISLDGKMMTQEIVDRIVDVGGYDPDGARTLVASILGYTPTTLPAEVDFRLNGAAAP